MAKGLIVLLHGVGSNGEDLAGLGAHWADTLPDVAFAAPDAPFSFEHGPGHQWFSLSGITPANRAERVYNAREAFDRRLSDVLAAHHMQDSLDSVVLAGFSQGSIMALDAVASGRWPIAGVVAFSGRFSSPHPYKVTQQMPVMLIHGMADSVIPWAESEAAARRLRELGAVVSTQFEASVGHSISALGARSAGEFIGKCLAR